MYFKLGQSRSTSRNVPCEDAKTDINDRIRGGSTACADNYLNEIEGESDDQLLLVYLIDSNETAETAELEIFTWLNDIKRDASNAVQAEDDGNRDNLMENKPFAEYFIKLCHMLPIWSAVCCPIFNSPHLIQFSARKTNTQPKSKGNSAKTANRKIRNLDSKETRKISAHSFWMLSIGTEEGYGEKRQCIACFRSTTSAVADLSETQKALNARESWLRKPKKIK